MNKAPIKNADLLFPKLGHDLSSLSLQKKLFCGVLLGVFVTTAFTLGHDLFKLANLIRSFRWEVLPLCIVAISIAFLGRFVKWQMYLRILGLSIAIKDSARIFFSGLSMTVTPGKTGEVLKAYLLKRQYNVSFSLSAPTIVAERLSGLSGAVLLAILASYVTDFYIPYADNLIKIGLTIIILVVITLTCRRATLKIFKYTQKVSFLENKANLLINMYNSACALNYGKVFLYCIVISAISWLAECTVLAVVLYGLGVEVPFFLVMFIYTLSSIAGGLSMLPGGLGIAEISMVGLLSLIGLDNNTAIVTTLFVRFITLWLGVGLGAVTFFNNRSVFNL